MRAKDKFLQIKQALGEREGERILAHALSCSYSDLFLHFDQKLSPDALVIAERLVEGRRKGIPFEYLVGKVDFFNCTLHVNPDVLIPRVETEILLAYALKEIGAVGSAWDLCTGSGALGLGLKKQRPLLDVTLSDLSSKAIAVAKKNAAFNQLAVELVWGDLFAPFTGKKAKYIFCNPPYISEKSYALLDKSVKEFEPKMALVAQEEGLEFYYRLFEGLKKHLLADGMAFLEIGFDQGKAVKNIFSPAFHCEIKTDFSGKDRFVFLAQKA